MLEEWHKWFKSGRRFTPNDGKKYFIDNNVIEFTNNILRQYGNQNPSSEGVVYWAGTIQGENYNVTCAVAPQVKASRYGFLTTHSANEQFVEFLCDHELVYISQVHSHPGLWVDHSQVDDEETAFRANGLLSVVVPLFSREGILPLSQCGIHIYDVSKFKRLSNKYIKRRFEITLLNDSKIILKDFR